MPTRAIELGVVGVLMTFFGSAAIVGGPRLIAQERPSAAASAEEVVHSSGEYMGQKWHIDEHHVMWWNGKPYVRFGFTGNGDIAHMLNAGFDQFTLMPEEEWPISGPDPAIIRRVDEFSDKLEQVKATYYGSLNQFWPWRYGNLIGESDRAQAFMRDVRDVTSHAGSDSALALVVRLPVSRAERDRVGLDRVRAILFDLDGSTRHDVTGYVASMTPIERDSEEARDGDAAPPDGTLFQVRFQPISFPQSGSLRLVIAVEVGLDEVPGAHGLPPLWKPGVRRFYRASLEAFRSAYAKPGLRGLVFGDEINTFPASLLTARVYLDIRRDAEALGAYRDWLARRFGGVEGLNRHLLSDHASMDQVDWVVPLHPHVAGLARTDAAAEREETWAGTDNTWGLADTVEQLRKISAMQEEFRDWFCGYWLAAYGNLAKETIGSVPVFVCSAAVLGPADRALAMHRWAMREGVDGLTRNHYGYGGDEERRTLASLAQWMANLQRESGCTKHLWANEVGYVRPGMTDAEWGATDAAELERGDSFGSQWAFSSQAALREMLSLLARNGYRGFHRFLMNPSADRAAREVQWMADLRSEMEAITVQAKDQPAADEPITGEQARAAAQADRRVQELLRDVIAPQFDVEFSDRWQVWVVSFYAGDRQLGFASVSPQGAVLEVGEPEAHQEAPQEEDRELGDGDRPESSLSLRFPGTARVHLPDAANSAALVTLADVTNETARRQLSYPFVLVEGDGAWTLISHRAAEPNRAFPSVRIRAIDGEMAVELYDVNVEAVQQATFATMEDAIADYQCWLERTYRIGRIGRHPNKPAWLANVRQVFTIDMWRPHGEITQDYSDVTRFLDELHRAGMAQDVLLYLCGWSAPYDARYPEYQPAEELGGTREFQNMVDTAHRYGCRVMIHTCPVAFDPWLPSFKIFQDHALKGDDFPGGYRGWPGGYRSRGLDLDSGRRTADGHAATFHSPHTCEASITIGGFGATRPTVTVRDRSLAVPDNASDPHTLAFPFFFQRGENQIRFSESPAELWYRVHDAQEFVHVWTYPFVAMDPTSPAWRSHVTGKIAAVVREFGLDAVHLDAHQVSGSTGDCLPLFEQVMEALPGVALSAEEGLGEVGLAVFGLTQGCLIGTEDMAPHSPVCGLLTEPYIRHYWHLVGARSWMPVAPVWNIDEPGEVTEEDRAQLKRDLARAERLGVVRTLRVNTRTFEPENGDWPFPSE